MDGISGRRMSKIADSNTNEYSYDELTRRTVVELGNNANTIYEYDLGNRLTNNIDDGNSITFDYASYDNVGSGLSMKIDNANAPIYT